MFIKMRLLQAPYAKARGEISEAFQVEHQKRNLINEMVDFTDFN